MPWLLYGETPIGELLHISEAARGNKCTCVCPFCKRPLAAKKGNIKVHHFSHLTETCAFVSSYDFLAVETPIDVGKSLLEWSEWKLEDINKERRILLASLSNNQREYERLEKLVYEAYAQLEKKAEINPRRKERSKVRQANYEVLQQLAAFLIDHNAPAPAFERLRDPEPCDYSSIIYVSSDQFARHHGHQQPTGRWKYSSGYYPSTLWEYPQLDFTPTWLAPTACELLNGFSRARRQYLAAKQKLEAFEVELERFNRFRLYFLLIEVPGQEAFFKIGITSRDYIEERIKEIKQDLKAQDPPQIQVIIQLSGYAFLESYFKAKYQPFQLKIHSYTEYFLFPDKELDLILADLKLLGYRSTDRKQKIKAGMTKAQEQGKKLGRPTEKEGNEKFLQKPKTRKIVALLQEGISLREIERRTNCSINTIRKVNNLLI